VGGVWWGSGVGGGNEVLWGGAGIKGVGKEAMQVWESVAPTMPVVGCGGGVGTSWGQVWGSTSCGTACLTMKFVFKCQTML